jgi:hypothetical protein
LATLELLPKAKFRFDLIIDFRTMIEVIRERCVYVGERDLRKLAHDLIGRAPFFIPSDDVLHPNAMSRDARFAAARFGRFDDMLFLDRRFHTTILHRWPKEGKPNGPTLTFGRQRAEYSKEARFAENDAVSQSAANDGRFLLADARKTSLTYPTGKLDFRPPAHKMTTFLARTTARLGDKYSHLSDADLA